MNDNIQIIKSKINMYDLFNHLGIDVVKDKIICPFHKDTNPSLSVNAKHNNETFRCFTCGAKGDVIKFVERFLHLDTKAAIDYLTELSGIEKTVYVKSEKSTQKKIYNTVEKKEISPKIQEIYDFLFNMLELTDQGKNYLLGRGLGINSISHFKVKSIDNPFLVFKKLKETFKFKLLKEAGFVCKDNLFIFRNPCLIFPIFEREKPVYFSNRNFKSNKKFRFQKLVGIEANRTYAGENTSKEKYHIAFEGVVDAMSYFEMSGKDNYVAVIGTAGFSEKNYSLLKEKYKEIVLFLDNDKAGRIIIESLKHLTPKVLAFEKLLKNTEFYKEFKILSHNNYEKIIDMNDILKLEELFMGNIDVRNAYISNFSSDDVRDEFLERVSIRIFDNETEKQSEFRSIVSMLYK